MLEHTFAVIMAGGGGTRLWPFSRVLRPKQMIRLGSQRTLFQQAIDRLEGLVPPEKILVVTVAEQALELQTECPQIPMENYLIEPAPRGTASVVGLAALAAQKMDPQATLLTLTADHLIQNIPFFQRVLRAAYQLAQEGHLVTLGIRPDRPSTAYGYIQRGAALEEIDGLQVFRAEKFREKPDEATARTFVTSGQFDWNSGMFVWRAERILEEIERWMPALAGVLRRLETAWETPRRNWTLQALWPGLKSIPVDYGIMEKSDRVAVLPAEGLGWNDVGSWDALFEVFPANEQGNVVLDAYHLGLDTCDSLVCAEKSGRLIVTIGIDSLIVVETQDALLICTRDSAQKVREVVNLLKADEQGQRFL